MKIIALPWHITNDRLWTYRNLYLQDKGIYYKSVHLAKDHIGYIVVGLGLDAPAEGLRWASEAEAKEIVDTILKKNYDVLFITEEQYEKYKLLL